MSTTVITPVLVIRRGEHCCSECRTDSPTGHHRCQDRIYDDYIYYCECRAHNSTETTYFHQTDTGFDPGDYRVCLPCLNGDHTRHVMRHPVTVRNSWAKP